MSPVGDLALSPRGLRVPTQERFFLQSLAGYLVGCVAEELGFSCDCTVFKREDAVLVGGVPLRDFLQGFQLISGGEDQYFPGGGFLRSLRHCHSYYHLASALSLAEAL